MEKIYRLRSKANELLHKRGHVFSRYQREFYFVKGALVKVLWNNCNRCGAWVRITDYPEDIKEMKGPAFEFNCKNGEVPLEKPEFGNKFAGEFRKEYFDRLRDKKRKTVKKFEI